MPQPCTHLKVSRAAGWYRAAASRQLLCVATSACPPTGSDRCCPAVSPVTPAALRLSTHCVSPTCRQELPAGSCPVLSAPIELTSGGGVGGGGVIRGRGVVVPVSSLRACCSRCQHALTACVRSLSASTRATPQQVAPAASSRTHALDSRGTTHTCSHSVTMHA